MKRKKQGNVKKGSPEWMATYSDLVTLLLCFFAVLFSMSSIDAEKFQAFINSFNNSVDMFMGAETVGDGTAIGNGINQLPDFEIMYYEHLNMDPEVEGDNLEELVQEFKDFIAENDLEDQIAVEAKDNYIKLQLIDDTILFDTGQAELKADAIGILEILSKELIKYRENQIKIEGHTDNIPINTEKYPSNWYLSSARAISVAEYLIEEQGFDPKKISADGRGEYSPIVANDTHEGRAKNRRVEIYIYMDEFDEILAE